MLTKTELAEQDKVFKDLQKISKPTIEDREALDKWATTMKAHYKEEEKYLYQRLSSQKIIWKILLYIGMTALIYHTHLHFMTVWNICSAVSSSYFFIVLALICAALARDWKKKQISASDIAFTFLVVLLRQVQIYAPIIIGAAFTVFTIISAVSLGYLLIISYQIVQGWKYVQAKKGEQRISARTQKIWVKVGFFEAMQALFTIVFFPIYIATQFTKGLNQIENDLTALMEVTYIHPVLYVWKGILLEISLFLDSVIRICRKIIPSQVVAEVTK
jgi:hypothetical protein